MKIRTLPTLLLCTAGLFCLAAPGHAQTDAAPTADAPAAAPLADAPPSADAPGTEPVLAPAPPTASANPAAAVPAPSASAGAAEAPAASVATANPAPAAINASDAPNPDDSDGIAATVNDESISDYELRQRIALFVATSGLQPSAEDMKRIRGQILDRMEDEKLQLQEAQKKHITVSPVEVDKQVNSLVAQNHITIDRLREILNNAGASELALRSQITAQIAWQKTVQDEYGDRINISPAQVDAEVQRYAEGANKPHFLVNEIFLPVSSPDQDAKVLKDAQNIVNQIQSGAPFQAMAHQFSQNPAAAQGGAIGWVHEGQLAPELNGVLVKMTQGAVSAPVRSSGGYYILQLEARQEPLGTKVDETQANAGASPDVPIHLARFLLPLGLEPSQEVIDSAMNVGKQLHENYTGCDQFNAVAGRMHGAVAMDLGMMKPSDLSPDIQKALAQTPPGETTPPLMSEAGVEVIGRCDARVQAQVAFTMPSRDQVESQLFDQQISALAQRYMRDLKRGANVEVR